MRTILVLGGLVLACARTSQGLVIDLLTTSPELAIWGSANHSLGYRVASGEVTGDRVPDLVVTATSDEPRVCIVPGPFTFPAEHDLGIGALPICIVPGLDSTLSIDLGFGLSIGDLDGDGIQDIVFGANGNGPDGTRKDAGLVAVFRGRANWPAVLHFDQADWIFHGIDPGDFLYYGWVGDLNGDSASDLVLSALRASGPGNGRSACGEAYIVFGPAAGWIRTRDLAAQPPDVVILGEAVDDNLGNFDLGQVSQIIGDPVADLVLGSVVSDGAGQARPGSGSVYILRGRQTWPSTIDLASSGSADFVLRGARSSDKLGPFTLGDWNEDGFADLIASSVRAQNGARTYAGAIHVVSGSRALTGEWDLLARPADWTILGPAAMSAMGWSPALGDVDGDGRLDLVAGADWLRPGAGGMVVVSGCRSSAAIVDLAAQPPDLTIVGARTGDSVPDGGIVLADVQFDGRADIFAGAPYSTSKDGSRPAGSGHAFLLLGRAFDAACTIAPDAGSAASLCLGGSTTLSGAATVVADCRVSPEFRWSEGARVIRDWLPSPDLLVAPLADTTYRLDVRCGDCASGVCTASASVTVTVDPDLTPGDLGNTLRAARAAGVDLSWGGDPLARSYSLHRSDRKELWPPTAHRPSLLVPRSLEPDLASPPTLYFYRATGSSCSGKEGP